MSRIWSIPLLLLASAVYACSDKNIQTAPTFLVSDCDIEPQGPQLEGSLLCTLDDALPNAPGLFTTWSEEMCVSPSWHGDFDVDGIDDSCERATAAAFAPMQVFASHDCSWDNGLGRMGGEYYYAVESKIKLKFINSQPVGYLVLRLAYLPAYYWDCGNASSFPFATWFDPAHSGDSEFMILDVAYDSSSHHWIFDALFLSAHCATPNDENCRWYSPPDIGNWVDGRSLGAPFIWVSRSKHANYVSEDQCDNAIKVGIIPVEDCELDTLQRFPVLYVQQNIGSRAHPFSDCGPPFSSSTMVDQSESECMWSWSPNLTNGPLGTFNGWQSVEVGPRSPTYGKHLAGYAGF